MTDPSLDPFSLAAVAAVGAMLGIFAILYFKTKNQGPRSTFSAQGSAADQAPEPEEFQDLDEEEWVELKESASRIVAGILNELPEDLRAKAIEIPTLFHRWAKEITGTELLGLYDGFDTAVGQPGGRITLFLGDILLYCDEEDLNFEDEVRRTWLHEFGHHLGWDEDDLEARGLD